MPSHRTLKNVAAAPRASSRTGFWLGAVLLVLLGGGIIASRRPAPMPAPQAQQQAPVQSPVDAPARQLLWHVVASYPHDSSAFTEGLLWRDGGFYESTGMEGQSSLRRVEFPSGKVVRKLKLPNDLFGEGLALSGNRLVQLTWQTRRGFVYDVNSFKLLREFSYPTEGWGMTSDGQSLIMSDGSDTLFFLDPQSFGPTRQLSVTLSGKPLRNLNELEWIDGQIWANVWQTNLIVRIDPASGKVISFLDLSGILSPSMLKNQSRPVDVLNGIAYDSASKRIFVTGKYWPRVFEIRVDD